MFGFFFGALCIAGLVFVLRRPYAFSHRGGWHRGWHGSDGWQTDERWGGGGPRGFGQPGRGRRMLRFVYERLGTSPGQETVLAEAVETVTGAAQGLRAEWEQSRGEFARAFRSEPLDVEGIRSTFKRHDERLKALRDVLLSESGRVHEALDGRQRTALADLLERTSGRGRWNL